MGCSGQAKTGALCILRQSVVPSVITHVPLPGSEVAWWNEEVVALLCERVAQHTPRSPFNHLGVTGLWSVCLEKEEPDEGPAFDDYLVMSFAGSTKLLATGEELQEATDVCVAMRAMVESCILSVCVSCVSFNHVRPSPPDSVEFAADTPTLAAGAAARGRLLIQVFAQGVRTLRTWAIYGLGLKDDRLILPACASLLRAICHLDQQARSLSTCPPLSQHRRHRAPGRLLGG